MDMKRFLVISLLITMLSSKGMCQGFLGSLISGALNVMAESKKNKKKIDSTDICACSISKYYTYSRSAKSCKN